MKTLTIGKAARAAGVNVETIRFYERRGLIPQPRKPQDGYRLYAPDTVERVRFIRKAQEIGFSLREVEELLSLRAHPESDCAEVRERAAMKIAEVNSKIAELERVRAALEQVVANCPGHGALSACSILEALEPSHRTVKVSQVETQMKTTTLKIEGMRCDGCAETIKRLIERQQGVKAAEVSHKEGEARVLYDPLAIDQDRLVAAVQKPGYRVVSSR
ncbi:MAG: MerR family DNA-binding protein [Rhizobiales bacterium]|nr:MerR family DNA-binding protein [Hyphomicrobiales bacterium]